MTRRSGPEETPLRVGTLPGSPRGIPGGSFSCQHGNWPAYENPRAPREIPWGPREVRLLDGYIGLSLNVRRKPRVETGVDATGVHDQEVAPEPVPNTVKTVSGDAGAVFHDGLTCAHETVEKRGLAHVWVRRSYREY